MRKIIQSNQFKRDYKKIAKSGRYSMDDFLFVVDSLACDVCLPSKYRDHTLSGQWLGFRECHIKPDWLLIYEKQSKGSEKCLELIRTGSHSALFE
ncbi:MAG TPA: type II toxin-antitoxin system YafQ family toxin [Gammaproteobacteria bacterium]|nr:type II toxin-antitoxin system YafQ family toxin [Gammaproteobacteria bacterium]